MPALVLFGLVFSVLFVNDYKLPYGMPAVYPLWLLLIAARGVCRLHPSKTELAAQCVLILLLLPPFVFELAQSTNDYYHGYVLAVLTVNAVSILPRLCRDPVVVYASLLVLLMVALVGLYQLSIGVNRGSFLFGSNVMYRVGVFFFGVFFAGATAVRTRVSGSAWVVLAYAACSLTLASTGSRGALVTWAVLSVAVYAALGLRTRAWHVKPLWLLALLLPVVSGYLFLQDRLWRLTYLSLANASESIRIEYVYQALVYMQQTDWMTQLFGIASEAAEARYFGFYPHNLFLESLVYGGWWLVLVVVLLYAHFLHVVIRSCRTFIGLAMPLIGVLVGSLFSGNLWYNYPIFSAGIILLIDRLRLGVKKPND